MTSHELNEKLTEVIRQERMSTNEVLRLINIGMERRAYLDLGFSSMFDWLTRGFGYSNAAAYRRIEAAKLLRSVPEVAAKLESGKVNLSTVSKAQSIIKAHEKGSGIKVDRVTKAGVVQNIENKSTQEAEQTLLTLFPDAALSVRRDHRLTVDSSTTRVSVNLPKEAEQNLNRAKQVLSHKFPHATDADVLAYALEFFLSAKDPLRRKEKPPVANSMTQTASAAEAKRVKHQPASRAARITANVRRAVIKSSDGACSYRDPLTGRACGSRHQVEIDHILPRALGGTDEAENLRLLCRAHNFHSAEKFFGGKLMHKFRRI